MSATSSIPLDEKSQIAAPNVGEEEEDREFIKYVPSPSLSSMNSTQSFESDSVFVVPIDEYRTQIPTEISSGLCWITGQRWTQEDTHILIDDLKLDYPELLKDVPFQRFSFYAIFDGHGGPRVSAMLHSWLLQDFLSQRRHFTDPSKLAPLIFKTFQRVSKNINQRCAQHNWADGSTAVVVIIADQYLYTSNVGDSEAVLACTSPGHGGGWQAIELTHYQNASNPEEAAAVVSRGGRVIDGRVEGCLALARAFGDIEFKAPWNGSSQSWITAEPFISIAKLTPHCRAVTIACDGLWDVLSHTCVVDQVKSGIKIRQDAYSIARSLVTSAIDSKSTDNITTIVVLLDYSN